MRVKETPSSLKLWLSAHDTYNWAHRAGASWPCSELSGHRVFAEFDANGDLVDMAIDGRTLDCDANEFNACTSDFLARRSK